MISTSTSVDGAFKLYGATAPSIWLSLSKSKPRYKCEKCGNECGSTWDAQMISVTIVPYDGEYCLKCYAAWIAANVPKMVELPPTKDAQEAGYSL
jgi:hypothetical protein